MSQPTLPRTWAGYALAVLINLIYFPIFTVGMVCGLTYSSFLSGFKYRREVLAFIWETEE